MFLKIDDLIVRRADPRDCDDLFEFLCLPDVARYQFWSPFTREQVLQLIEGQSQIEIGDPGVAVQLVVEHRGRVIGDCQLTITSVEDRQGEIGFSFNPRDSGQGLATRSVTALLGLAFLAFGLHRVVAGTDTRNERCCRLLDRIGMRREAQFRHDTFSKEEWVDSYVYAMLEDEWHVRHEAVSSQLRKELGLEMPDGWGPCEEGE